MSDETKPFRGRPVPIPAFVQPPTPDPRERGLSTRVATEETNQALNAMCEAAEFWEAFGDGIVTVEIRVGGSLIHSRNYRPASLALRAPAPSEAVACAECGGSGEAPKCSRCEGTGSDGNGGECRWCRTGDEKREGASFCKHTPRRDVCEECAFERGYESGLSGREYYKAHPEDPRAATILTTHPATARGVTVTEAMVERGAKFDFIQRHGASDREWKEKFWRRERDWTISHVRRLLAVVFTPDAEGGA